MDKIKLENKMKGFPDGIDWAMVLHRALIDCECGIKNSIVRCFSLFWHTRYTYDIKTSNGARILFFESYNGRTNFVNYVLSLSNMMNSDVAIEKKGNKTLDFFSGIKILLFYLPSWKRQLKKAKLGKDFERKSLYYLVKIYRTYYDLKGSILEPSNIERYNLYVTFYDSMPKEAFLVQYMHLNGLKTATLQHGAFTAKRNNQIVNSGVELRTINSDYFLCWNRFTVDEALKEGVELEKCVVVGIIGFSNNDTRVKCNEVSNNTFGVVIGHPTFEKENKILIESANLLARKTGKCFYLKLHPKYSDTYFEPYVDNSYYMGIVKKGIPMLDYANSVEFSLVGASTVFVELVYLRHRVLRYSSGEIVDKWRDIRVGSYFQKPENVVYAYEGINNMESEKQLFDYLCTVEDVKNEYRCFFSKFQ